MTAILRTAQFLKNVRVVVACILFGLLPVTGCTDNTLNKKGGDNAAGNTRSEPKLGSELQAQADGFRKQPHRLEFNGCSLIYNNKPYSIGGSVDALQEVMGPYDIVQDKYLVWKEVGLIAVTDFPSNPQKIIVIDVFFDNYPHEDSFPYSHTKKDTLLFDGVPMNSQISSADFMAQSKFDWGDFALSSTYLEYRYHCGSSVGDAVYSLGLDSIWNYKGAGHLMLKDTVDKNNPNPFNSFFVQLE